MEPQRNKLTRADQLNETEGASSLPEEFANSQEAERQDEIQQEEYRRRHLEQLRRLQCPGCGETDIF